MEMPGRYSRIQSWAHDTLIADRALNLHDYIIKHSKLVDILSEKVERILLDVGCGGGQAAIRMKDRYPYLHVTGIDTSKEMIAGASRRARSKGYAIRFEVADAQALPFPDASFDVVYSFGSAKHWPDPLKGMSECWRVLRPGGELLVSDATSDATLQEVHNFYSIAGLPNLLKKPVSAIPVFTFIPSFSNSRAIKPEVRDSWNPNSGCRWMSRRIDCAYLRSLEDSSIKSVIMPSSSTKTEHRNDNCPSEYYEIDFEFGRSF